MGLGLGFGFGFGLGLGLGVGVGLANLPVGRGVGGVLAEERGDVAGEEVGHLELGLGLGLG